MYKGLSILIRLLYIICMYIVPMKWIFLSHVDDSFISIEDSNTSIFISYNVYSVFLLLKNYFFMSLYLFFLYSYTHYP